MGNGPVLPASGVDDAPLVTLQINAEWRGPLLAALSVLEDGSSWADATDMEAARVELYTLYSLIVNAV